MAISHCFWQLVVKYGNFTLLLIFSGQEWQFHIATDIWGQEWLFHIATDISGLEWLNDITTDILS